MNHPKRLIEVDLPIKRISAHARREKSIRHGHISTLHIWWARRPLAACRAVICASLWFDPADELCPPAFRETAREQMRSWAMNHRGLMSAESYEHFEAVRKNPARLDDDEVLRTLLLDFIADFANWDNSTRAEYLETSRALTQAAHVAAGGEPDTRPLVVDPFAGGGSIPLEALRVGADAFSSDLNAIPVLLNKVVLEYIPKYGHRLTEEVEKYSVEILRKAKELLTTYYPVEQKKSEVVTYLWFKTILSEDPSAGDLPIEVPLIRSMWLSKGTGRNLAMRWVRNKQGHIVTRTKEVTYANGKTLQVREPLIEVFTPQSSADVECGTSKGGAATCPISGFTTPVESVRRQLSERRGGAADARLGCLISVGSDGSGRKYRIATDDDLNIARSANAALDALKRESNMELSLLPESELNHLRGFFNVVLYGMTQWCDLFSPRQSLSLTTFARLIREVEFQPETRSDKGLSVAVQTCLAMALGRQVDYSSNLCVWASNGEFVCHTFGRQALPMVWDYSEVNPLSGTGWSGACEWVRRVIEANANAHMHPGTAVQASALNHPLPTDSADATITDPPYYAAIPYADLSDFFYGWLRRSVGTIHKDLFTDELSPKEDECVSLSHRAAMYRHKDGAWFETKMAQACGESRRITKPSGIGLFVFANKETQGWEAMLGALIGAGWVITASWPIDTERGGRLRARNSAALASSVHLVCRPRENTDGSLQADLIGDWRDVLRELPQRIQEWMPRLTQEGVVGADAIFACLGPALEVFSRYSRVEKASGEQVTLREYLEYVWAAVAKEALTLIFEGTTDADVTGFEADARLTAMWLWTLFAGATSNGDRQVADEEEDESADEESARKAAKSGGFTLEYDAARKIAQGLGAHLDELATLVEVKGDKARLLPVAERTKYLFGKDEAEAPVKRKKKDPQAKLFENLDEVEEVGGWGSKSVPNLGNTVLDRIHQSMILFAAGRGEALRRFLVEDGVGRDERFWRLANALSALYPANGDEKRWVDGVLARKKGLGF